MPIRWFNLDFFSSVSRTLVFLCLAPFISSCGATTAVSLPCAADSLSQGASSTAVEITNAIPGTPGTKGDNQEQEIDLTKITHMLATSKPLKHYEEFFPIDDFNSGEFKNKIGTSWDMEPAGTENWKATFDSSNARTKNNGGSLKLSYDLQPGDEAWITSSFLNLDVSRGEILVFLVKGLLPEAAADGPGLSFYAEDIEGKSAEHFWLDGKIYPAREGWALVLMPLTGFKGIDFNRLQKIGFKIKAKGAAAQGDLWIDDLAFFGTAPLEFKSRQDNLIRFPEILWAKERQQWLQDKGHEKTYEKVFLREIARDTWKYFAEARDKDSYLIVDHIRLGPSPAVADYTSITNIGLDFLSAIAAMDLGLIPREEAVRHIDNALTTLEKLKKWKGFFYNYYNTSSLRVSRHFISSVDSAWLAVSLVVLRQAFPDEFGGRATRLLDGFDFMEFLDPEFNQLAVGFDTETGELTGHHYGLLVSEARIASLYAIGKGDIPKDHWWYIFRTLPDIWEWQGQKPKGEFRTEDNIEYFQGYYEWKGKKFVPSWGGSLFEYLMPTLVVKERELAPLGLGMNNRIATELHRHYALKEKGYPVWGISPATFANGAGWQYSEFGIKELSAKGYPDRQIITPHVGFLALDSLPEAAVDNIRKFLDLKIYGEYGFYDSINIRAKEANPQYLALDQGMILVALCNYLKAGSIQERFHADPIGRNIEDLLESESFFN